MGINVELDHYISNFQPTFTCLPVADSQWTLSRGRACVVGCGPKSAESAQKQSAI